MVLDISGDIENSVNDSNDSNVTVIVMDSGFVPPSGATNIIYSTEVVAGNVGPHVSDSHVTSGEVVVASDSPSAQPPPANFEVEMVCGIGFISDRWKTKQDKYRGIRHQYPDYKVNQVNAVFDFLAEYH